MNLSEQYKCLQAILPHKAGCFVPQLPHESFRVVHLTKNYKPKQHQETHIIMLILKRKTSQQWLVFVFIIKAFVTIEISRIFVMLIPSLRRNITQATHTLLKSTLSKPHNF